jgi:2-aminoethylphosphonate-pyruvate transaminase
MTKKLMLFTPGPVMTSKSLKLALGHPDMPHRRPCFEEIIIRVRENLHKLYGANEEYGIAVISGSGTAANETALSSIIRDTDEVLLLKNGIFGDRLDDILTCYRYKIHRIESHWGKPIDLIQVEEALQENPKIRWTCIVYHETSTGMINPVKKMGELVTKYNRRLFVDCVSAIGGEPINVVQQKIDVCTGSGNKAIAGTTGISFVCAKRLAVPKLEVEVPRRNIYLNLQNHLKWADELNQTPNTPAVTMFIGLDTALKELFEEGLDNRIRRYRECSQIIRDGLRSMELQLLINDDENSNTLTSVFLPKNVGIDQFIDELEKRGYVVYPGKGSLYKQNLIQIATMGWICPQDCHDLIRTIDETIQSLTSLSEQIR